jgi:transcriptional regulator with XRE-family HTH domain
LKFIAGGIGMATAVVPEAIAIRRKIISVLLQGARLKAGKSKKECAVALGVSSGAYSAYEAGTRDVSLPELEVLAHFLKMPVSDFFENQERVVREEPQISRAQVVQLRQRIIGALLRKARLDKGKSSKELAEQLSISPHRMTQYEFGQQPIPVAQLQEVADLLQMPMRYFIDEGFGTIGEEAQTRNQFQQFSDLPEDIRKFVANPSNVSYLRVAQRLASMTTEQLRDIAASILDITY